MTTTPLLPSTANPFVVIYPEWIAAESGAAVFAGSFSDPADVCTFAFNRDDLGNGVYLATKLVACLAPSITHYKKAHMILLGTHWVDFGYNSVCDAISWAKSNEIDLQVTVYCVEMSQKMRIYTLPNVVFFDAFSEPIPVGPCSFLMRILRVADGLSDPIMLSQVTTHKHFWFSALENKEWVYLMTQIDDRMLNRYTDESQYLFYGIRDYKKFECGNDFFAKFCKLFYSGPNLLADVIKCGQTAVLGELDV